MRVLVVGSNGQLGKELVKQICRLEEHHLLTCDIDQLDITILDDVKDYVSLNNPEVIINCAAYTAVDACENHVDLAFSVNAIGPRNLAIACQENSIKLVHVSTDYVFNGKGIENSNGEMRPYREMDPIDPQSVYGESKAAGEQFVKDFCSRYFIIRTAWLYGDGDNFVKTMINLSNKNDTLKVVNDQVGSPTSTIELSKAVLSLITTEAYGVYHGTCEGSCSWFDFAEKIFQLSDIEINILPCSSDEYIRPAKRPNYSVLDNMMFRLNTAFSFRDWEECLVEYLEKLQSE